MGENTRLSRACARQDEQRPFAVADGLELIAPDLSYLKAAGKLDAILLTHAHEDHVGALPYLLREFPDAAVCGTRFTLAVVKEKLAEHGISADLQTAEPRTMGMVGNH